MVESTWIKFESGDEALKISDGSFLYRFNEDEESGRVVLFENEPKNLGDWNIIHLDGDIKDLFTVISYKSKTYFFDLPTEISGDVDYLDFDQAFLILDCGILQGSYPIFLSPHQSFIFVGDDLIETSKPFQKGSFLNEIAEVLEYFPSKNNDTGETDDEDDEMDCRDFSGSCGIFSPFHSESGEIWEINFNEGIPNWKLASTAIKFLNNLAVR